MISFTETARQHEIDLEISASQLCRLLRPAQQASLLLDGCGGFSDAWDVGPLVAVEPRELSYRPAAAGQPTPHDILARIEERLRQRLRHGGTAQTGLAVLLSYEALDEPRCGKRADGASPRIRLFEVDRSVSFRGTGRPVYAEHGSAAGGGPTLDRLRRVVDASRGDSRQTPSARVVGPLTTNLGREAYLDAVRRIKRHIFEGEIYQANLCQRFSGAYAGDPLAFYEKLRRSTPAPRSAFVEAPGLAIASVSPEIFLRVSADEQRIETWPIKGTRPRCEDRDEDRRAASELVSSAKDRAELLMIVDLERNDLGRICRTGSVEVRHHATLRSFAQVHHLVACVEGRLRRDVGLAAMLGATFPGGSISGAPKKRARQILAEIEAVVRGPFTGCLVWFGDDGSVDSSILIRTVVFSAENVTVGAGGGIVADSDPQQEWLESMHKARAPLSALGWTLEDAG